jgi:hypothetical protein
MGSGGHCVHRPGCLRPPARSEATACVPYEPPSVPQEIEWIPRPQGSRGAPGASPILIFLSCRCMSTVVAVEGIRHRHAVSGV